MLLKEDINLIGLRTTDLAPFPHITMGKVKYRKENELAQSQVSVWSKPVPKFSDSQIQLLVHGAWKSGMHLAKKKKIYICG